MGKTWEFATLGTDVGAMPPHAIQMGAEGWELVCALDTERGVMLYFKRETSQPKDSSHAPR